MIRCPLHTFVDFACCTGSRKVAVVRDLKAGRGYDFYAPLVAAIQDMHASGFADPATAAEWLTNAVSIPTEADRRKASIYPKLIAGYVKLLGELGPTTWALPEAIALPVGEDVELEVAPELGLVIASSKLTHLLALHTHGEPLSGQRALLTAFLTNEAHGAGHLHGVVDVMRSRMVVPTVVEPEEMADLRALVKGEAASFERLWALV